MQNRAFSTCQRVLTLGLGVGGMLNVLCASALSQTESALLVEAELSASENSDGTTRRPKAALKPAAPLDSAVPLSPTVSLSPTQVSFSSGPSSSSPSPSVTPSSVLPPSSPPDSASSSPLSPPQSSSRESSSQGSPLAAAPNTVEDAAVPRFSPRVCRQAACLTGPVVEVIAPHANTVNSAETASVNLDIVLSEATEKPTERPIEQFATSATTEETESEKTEAKETETDFVEIAVEEGPLYGGLLHPEASVETPNFLSDITDESSVDPDIELDTEPDVEPGIRPDIEPDIFLNNVPDDALVEDVLITDDVLLDDSVLDNELGTLRLQQTRSRSDNELGILRLMQTAKAPPPPPKPPIAFLGGRLGFFNTNNAFRSEIEVEEQIYQSGLALYLFPKLSEKTSLYAIAETGIARYEVDYNELEVQAGLRHRLLPRTFAQIGWRNQKLYTPGFREKLLGINYLDALVSHRRILSKRAWADGFYQIRLGFADPVEASRFRQTLVASINYAATPNLRTSLLYQLEFDDYLRIDRYDISQQFLGALSYNLTPESKISLFGGTRFGSSSAAGVDLSDVFYGAGLNVNVPLF